MANDDGRTKALSGTQMTEATTAVRNARQKRASAERLLEAARLTCSTNEQLRSLAIRRHAEVLDRFIAYDATLAELDEASLEVASTKASCRGDVERMMQAEDRLREAEREAESALDRLSHLSLCRMDRTRPVDPGEVAPPGPSSRPCVGMGPPPESVDEQA